MKPVTFAHEVQSIQFFLLVLIQFLEDVVATAFSIDYRVSFFPACHYQVESISNGKLSIAYFDKIVVVDLETKWQLGG